MNGFEVERLDRVQWEIYIYIYIKKKIPDGNGSCLLTLNATCELYTAEKKKKRNNKIEEKKGAAERGRTIPVLILIFQHYQQPCEASFSCSVTAVRSGITRDMGGLTAYLVCPLTRLFGCNLSSRFGIATAELWHYSRLVSGPRRWRQLRLVSTCWPVAI